MRDRDSDGFLWVLLASVFLVALIARFGWEAGGRACERIGCGAAIGSGR